MEMTYLVVAESEELALPWAKAYSGCPAIITGPGIVNVIRALTGIDRKADIVNVGYCGAVGLPVGTEVRVARCATLHHRAKFYEEPYILETQDGSATCYTSTDFVTSADGLSEGDVCDMELAAICALGFNSVRSYKYVSDNLDKSEYIKTINREYNGS